jgi:hypothetical protein
VLYENSTHRSPSIVAENSKTGPKSAIDFASIPVDKLGNTAKVLTSY